MAPATPPFRAAAALSLALLWTGCGAIASAVEPVRAPAHSALELERVVQAAGALRTDFSPGARLRTLDGSVLEGGPAARRYLGAGRGARDHSFRFFTDQVSRCDAASGLEIGWYQAVQRVGGSDNAVSGTWWAVWETTGEGEWRIREAALLGDAADAQPTSTCITPADEHRARSRITVAAHVSPVGYRVGTPHDDVRDLGLYPFFGTRINQVGAVGRISYRMGDWFAVGSYFGREPGYETLYLLHTTRETLRDGVTTTTSFAAATVGYDGRLVSLDAGPAVVDTRWEWTRNAGFPTRSGEERRVGAVATLHLALPAGDFIVDLMAQQRWFGHDDVPRLEEPARASQNGLFLGVGLGVRF
jgi:hypothetical protein